MKPLQIGDNAPDFVVDPTDNSTLYGLIQSNQTSAVVYFYPMDFSPVCSAQACMVRDIHNLADSSTPQLIIGVSPQSARVHKRFKSTMKLPQKLVSDQNNVIAKSYGAVGLFGFVRRLSFTISMDYKISDRAGGAIGLANHRKLVTRTTETTTPPAHTE